MKGFKEKLRSALGADGDINLYCGSSRRLELQLGISTPHPEDTGLFLRCQTHMHNQNNNSERPWLSDVHRQMVSVLMN